MTAFTAVSAFEAARQAKLPQPDPENELATSLAETPYDGHVDGDSDSEEVNVTVNATPPKRNLQLSTWKPTRKNVRRDDAEALEISLKPDEKATFIGSFDLEVLSGVVSVYGAMLHPNSGLQRIDALATSAIPALTAKKPSTLRLMSISRSLDRLENLSPLFRNVGARDEKRRSFKYLASTSEDLHQRPLSPLEVEEDTKRVLSRISARLEAHERPRVMAVGAKSSGKSTLNRLLCNMIVTRPGGQKVTYLDIDPGQPEFGAPGQISMVEVTSPLLGPSYSHLATAHNSRFRLIRAHNIAATSFKDDPDHYVNCVLDLMRHLPRNVPLIVNSCGRVSGTGAGVLIQLLSQLRITDAVCLQPLDGELDEQLKAVAPNIHTVGKRTVNAATRTPAEQRAMQTMAYFHGKNGHAEESWNSKPINMMRPWTVNYSGPKPGIAAILSYGQAPQPEFLAEVIDGMVVALVVPEDDLIDPTSVERTPQEDLPYIVSHMHGSSLPMDPRRSHCVGMALVRGIDAQNKRVHLLTPLSQAEIAELMRRQVVLVRGGFDCPEWAYLEDMYLNDSSTKSSSDDDDKPWVSLREPVGIEGSVWRLRHPPTAADAKK